MPKQPKKQGADPKKKRAVSDREFPFEIDGNVYPRPEYRFPYATPDQQFEQIVGMD